MNYLIIAGECEKLETNEFGEVCIGNRIVQKPSYRMVKEEDKYKICPVQTSVRSNKLNNLYVKNPTKEKEIEKETKRLLKSKDGALYYIKKRS